MTATIQRLRRLDSALLLNSGDVLESGYVVESSTPLVVNGGQKALIRFTNGVEVTLNAASALFIRR